MNLTTPTSVSHARHAQGFASILSKPRALAASAWSSTGPCDLVRTAPLEARGAVPRPGLHRPLRPAQEYAGKGKVIRPDAHRQFGTESVRFCRLMASQSPSEMFSGNVGA
jgi:hypothetical protein